MTAEDSPAKAVAPVVEAMNRLAEFVRSYTQQ
jgi:hypothetical protein